MLCPITHSFCKRGCSIGKCYVIKRGISDARRLQEGLAERRANTANAVPLDVSANNYTPPADYYKDV